MFILGMIITAIIIIAVVVYEFFSQSIVDVGLDFCIAVFSFFKNWFKYDLPTAKKAFHQQFSKQLDLSFPLRMKKRNKKK